MMPTEPTAQKPLQRISASEFARRLSYDLDEQDKRYAFFLGSGCSVSSGIKTAGGLVTDEWLPKLHKLMAPEMADYEAWGTKEFDFNPIAPAASYGVLMKRLFLQREEQQREIERLCDNKFPAFGYSVLAELMERAKDSGTFNVVLTTNFDDLVADALYLFTSIRPLIIHHESLAGYIRPTRTRPLIVKLHGDNHLSPYNTPEQTASLSDSTNKQVRNLLHDRGLIFLGYSGNDESIMHLLDALPEDALPLGIYWCSQQEPSCQLSSWLHKRDAIWVESPRFDEFMLLVHAAMNLGHPKPKRFEEVFEKRMELYKKLTGSIKKALPSTIEQVALKEAVKKTDKSFRNWWSVELEASRLQKDSPLEAGLVYEKGIKKFPESSELLYNYALFLNSKKRFQESENYYLRSIKAAPTDADYLGSYAVFLNEQKRPQEAEGYYNHAIKANPKGAIHLGNYAIFLHEQKRPQEAEGYYKKAIKADPTDSTYLGNYALFLKVHKRFLEAENYYIRSVEADPVNASTLGNYAVFLNEQKRPQEAEGYYNRAIKADSVDAAYLDNYAIFLHEQKRPQEAEGYFKHAIELDSANVDYLGNYAYFLNGQKRYKEAEEYYKQAIEADLTGTRSLGSYAIFLNEQKRYAEAEDYYKRAIEADPIEADYLSSYAQFLNEQKRPEEAENHYKQAVEAAPLRSYIVSNYAQFILGIDCDLGLSILDQAQAIVNDDTPYQVLLELAFYELAHRPPLGNITVLQQIKTLLEEGVRCKDWSFSSDIAQAQQRNHPFIQWLPKLSAIMIDEATLDILVDWPEWNQIEV